MKTNIDDATLQDAIDAACQETTVLNGYQSLDLRTGYSGWGGEAPARLALARALLDRLPEPTPPAVDGKTPGQVFHEASRAYDEKQNDAAGWKSWNQLDCQKLYEVGASAVLAAFGGAGLEAERLKFALMGAQQGLEESRRAIRKLERQLEDTQESSLEQAIARMEAVPDGDLKKEWLDLKDASEVRSRTKIIQVIRARLIAAAREDCGADAVPEIDPITRLARDWKIEAQNWESIAKVQQAGAAAYKARAEKAEAELTAVKESLESKYRVFSQDNEALEKRLYAAEAKPKLSRLRPIAEAGPVPDGAVRWYGYLFANKWQVGESKSFKDTHFADIYPPKASPPAVEAEPEPTHPWAAGDKVQLKGGSFTMTVEQADSDGIACEWHDSNGVPQARTYTTETLQPA